MNQICTFKNLTILTAISMMAACGSDDEVPPPALDCAATGPSITLAATPTVCGEDSGEIAVTVAGGTGNLAFTIEPQPLGVNFDNGTFTSLEPGDYTIEVTDANNCSTSANTTVVFSAANLSYMDDVDAIVQSKCAITGCHVSGTGLPDYTIFAEFKARANNELGGVRQRVKTDDMPRSGGPLSAEEKAALFCWIDEGALDN